MLLERAPRRRPHAHGEKGDDPGALSCSPGTVSAALSRDSSARRRERSRQRSTRSGTPTSTTPSPTDTRDRKSTRLNSSHGYISYAVFCLKKKNNNREYTG